MAHRRNILRSGSRDLPSIEGRSLLPPRKHSGRRGLQFRAALSHREWELGSARAGSPGRSTGSQIRPSGPSLRSADTVVARIGQAAAAPLPSSPPRAAGQRDVSRRPWPGDHTSVLPQEPVVVLPEDSALWGAGAVRRKASGENAPTQASFRWNASGRKREEDALIVGLTTVSVLLESRPFGMQEALSVRQARPPH